METTPTGNFYLPVLSGQIRLVARLTDGTRLEKVSDGDEYLWIDLPSHLTSLYSTAHRELTLAQAEQAVRQGLSIPDGTGAHGLSSLRGSPFSARIFLGLAAREGGFDAYCNRVVQRISAGEKLRFQVEPPGDSSRI